MKKITPFKLLLLIVTLFATTLTTRAQMLETVDMGSPGTGLEMNTYLTGINNRGYVTGYYTSLSNTNVGLIITPTGRKLIIHSNIFGATDVKVESINDNGVAVLTVNNGATVSLYKCYLDTLNDTIGHYVPISGISQPSSVAFDINNNNDISGWFQASTRFLWVKHDSIVPIGNIAFESNRVEIGIDVYNTFAGGVNDANKVSGFYIDGSLIKPFVYDNLTENFTYLNSAFKIKLWDINNNGWVAGEYLQTTNNVYMGFIANASTGSLTQFTSMNSIFDNNAIQSVANAINDNGEVVGSYYHPGTNTWKGFIYRPNLPEFRIPGYNFNDDNWKLDNEAANNNNVWPSSYWGGFNYNQSDPYNPNAGPLMDNFLIQNNPNLTMTNDRSPDWLSFGKETDASGIGTSSNPYLLLYYENIMKHLMFDKYMSISHDYRGHCYGITYTELLRHFDDNLFSTWYNFPANTNISNISNTNNNAIQGIARMYIKQHNQATIAKYATDKYADEDLWSGLHKMKMEFLKSWSESNPRSLSFEATGGGFHSVLPYKIRTPRTLPFDSPALDYDTLFIHDSYFPGDSTRYILVNSTRLNTPHSSVVSNDYSLAYISLNKASIREVMDVPFTNMKSTSAGDDPNYTMTTDGPSDYTITTGTGQVTALGGVYNNNTTDLQGLIYESTTSDPPVAHLVDTAGTAYFHTGNYTNASMIWKQYNKNYSMSLSRAAATTEQDNGAVEKRKISYGNPDNNTKYINGSFTEIASGQQQGVSILATNICADQGDSIVTSNPSQFVYQITKVSGSATCTYNLTVFAAYNGTTVNEFSAPVVLSGTTTHTIDPYFVGLNGVQIAVIVDNGNDGTTDDTLFIAGFPVDMKNTISKGGIKVYPNPVRDELNVEFATAGKYSIIITDVVGRTISNNTMSVSAGRTVLPMDQYPNDVYLIQVTDEKGRSLLKDKIIKQ